MCLKYDADISYEFHFSVHSFTTPKKYNFIMNHPDRFLE